MIPVDGEKPGIFAGKFYVGGQLPGWQGNDLADHPLIRAKGKIGEGDYLRGGSARDLRRVLQHNDRDLVSLGELCLKLAEPDAAAA